MQPDRPQSGFHAEAGGLGAEYRAIVEALPTPIVVIDPPDFVMVVVNDARCRVTNTRAEDVLGRRLFDVFPDNPEDPESQGFDNLRASLDRVLATRRTDVMAIQKYDIRDTSGDFEERWWSPTNIPVLAPDGSVRHIIHQVEDVTDEMRERRRASLAEASAARFRDVADALPGLVFETDLQARNTYVNEHYLQYTGLHYDALLGDRWRQVVHPDDRDRTVEALLRSLRTCQPFECETRIRRADGEWRWFLVRATPLRGAHRRVQRAIGVCTDVDAAKRGEAVLRDLHELQATLLEEVSHRVKNNLMLVASLLTTQARTAGNGAGEALEQASRRIITIARVHDQLWRGGVGTTEIDLKPFLGELCTSLGTSTPSHATRCDLEAALVSADVAIQLGLVVNELLTNAYKYAYPEEAEDGEVRLLGTREPGERYRLEVRDFGRGLPPEFDLTKPTTSLGMRVIPRIATKLRAELRAEQGHPGARFTLVFPLRP